LLILYLTFLLRFFTEITKIIKILKLEIKIFFFFVKTKIWIVWKINFLWLFIWKIILDLLKFIIFNCIILILGLSIIKFRKRVLKTKASFNLRRNFFLKIWWFFYLYLIFNCFFITFFPIGFLIIFIIIIEFSSHAFLYNKSYHYLAYEKILDC
jgi:hypothetical protein